MARNVARGSLLVEAVQLNAAELRGISHTLTGWGHDQLAAKVERIADQLLAITTEVRNEQRATVLAITEARKQ